MRKYLFGLLLLSSSVSSDPFFGKDFNNNQDDAKPEKSQFEGVVKNVGNHTACKPAENRASHHLDVEFEKLKLVGLVKINEHPIALFIDEKEHLIEIKEGDLIYNREIEITNINMRSITYINWKLTKNCDSPHEIKIKL